MKDTMIGVDLAKNVFQIRCAMMTGHLMFREKLIAQPHVWNFSDAVITHPGIPT